MQRVHLYYPTGLGADDPAYRTSVEAQRLTRLLEDAQKDMRPWIAFLHRVRQELPGCMLWDMTLLWIEPCYRLRVYLPGITQGGERQDAVVCLLSLLAPVYALYASHSLDTEALTEAWTRFPPLPPEFQSLEARLAGLVEDTFGATRPSNEALFTPVPALAPRTGNVAPGKALLVDLLLTRDRW
jgi:hypothetical protein